MEAGCCCAERVARVIIPHRLCHCVGNRLLGQHIIADRPANAEAQHTHVDIDAGRANLLPFLGALADELQAQLTEVALFILGVDIQLMFIPVTHVQILRNEQILLHIAGAAFKLHGFTVQLDGQLCFRAGCEDVTDGIARGILCPCFDGQVDLLPVGDGIAVAQVRLDLDAVFAPVFIRNVKYKRIAVAACAGGRDRKCVAAGPVAFQQERHAAAGGRERDRFEAAGLVALDRLYGHVRCFLAADGKRVGKKSICQLIVIDRLGVDGPLVLARQHAGLLRAVLHDRVGHLHADVALVADGDRERDCAILDRCGHEDGIGRAILCGFKLDRTAVRVHSSTIEAGACDLRILRTFAGQSELIQKLTVADLVVLDGQRRALVRIAENVLRRDGLFVPCKLQLEIKSVLIRHNECIADGLPQHLGGHGEIVGIRVLAVCRSHLDLAGFRERAAFAVCRPVFRRADDCIVCVFTQKGQRICKSALGQRVALDRAADRPVGRAGGLTGRLPGELQIEVNAAFQPQHERKFHIRLHGLALLVLLCRMRLHGQDIVLVLRAVRQRHVQHTARIRILRYAVARSDLYAGDLRVVCVESGEINIIAQSAAIQLGKQHALADRFSGGADHGACLRTVLVPRQHCAEVKLRFRQVFVCLAGVSGFFALIALVGIRIRTNGGVGQDFLLGLALRLLLRLGVLSLLRLVFRFLRVCLLLLAGQLAVGAAARTGSILAFRFAVSGMAGRLPCLQDGDLLRRGLQDGILRLGRPHAHERQTDTQQQRADEHAAAGLLQPWEPFK